MLVPINRSFITETSFLFMKWGGCVLKTKKTTYRFKSQIIQCAQIGDFIVAVLERSIIFIEKSGELIKHPTCKIRTAGFLSAGVIYSEEDSLCLKYITHPYETIHSFSPISLPFDIVAAHKDRFVLLCGSPDKVHVNIYRGAPPNASLVFSSEREGIVKIYIRGTRHAIVQEKSVIVCALSRRLNESKVKREITYTPVSGAVESVIPIKMTRGAYFLVNGAEVISEYGLVFNIASIPPETLSKYITQKALAQIEIVKRGKYCINELSSFFQYASSGQRLFGTVMPSENMHSILKAYVPSSGVSLDSLFSSEIMALSKKSVEKISAHIEQIAHVIKYIHTIKTVLFRDMAIRNKNSNKKRAYLFWMLSTGSLPKKALEYEIFSYKEDLLQRSKNIGYLLLKSDQRIREMHQIFAEDVSVSHTLEDPEHIREVPSRLRNTGVIEECKRLLSGHQVCDFLFDVYDTENRRKKAFIFSSIASVGRGVFFLNRNNQVNVFQVPQLKVFLKKNSNVVSATDLVDWDSMWPSFHFAVATSLSIPNRPFISTSHIEIMTPRSLMALAGSIFGFGLKTAVCQNNLSIGEKLNLSRSLILSLSKSHDSLLIAATVLGNSFIIKETGNKDHARIIRFNMQSPTSPSHLLLWSVLSLGILYMGHDDLFAKQALIEYMQRKGAICSSSMPNKKSYYDKYHRVAAAFSFAYIMLGSRVKEYVRLPDRTCEIIVNGLVHMKSGWEKISSLLEENCVQSSPLNRFYASLMTTLVLGDTSKYKETLKEALEEVICVENTYSLAGKILAYGLLFIPEIGKKPQEKFISDITSLLYNLERSRSEHPILLDYTLLACCLVLNSTGDLCILGTCKRLLDSLRCIDALEKITDFSPSAGNYREQYGMRFGRIQHIKMCLSLLVPGCGSMRISPTQKSIAFIVTSFYPEFPLTPEDQDAFQVIRHFYLLSLVPTEDSTQKQVDRALALDIGEELKTAEKVDKKAAVDIITSYFEKNNLKSFNSNCIETLITNLYTDLL
ncbi:hypothetical protein NEMIN01_1676 [Nematocida minor]|uniref:uncharacterized protein n=1 Tax=Nematocida minor TaxID=1912983 RepID=UPI00221E9C11|nr:uncharacterized protein NEMIN01_1676 [Nematocida minor]KAI5191785.1 hypothetical protein NEMIN01_1676 [Nematocida minor]